MAVGTGLLSKISSLLSWARTEGFCPVRMFLYFHLQSGEHSPPSVLGNSPAAELQPPPQSPPLPQEAADGSGAIVSSRQGTATSLQNQPRIQKASSEMLLLKLSFCSCHFLTFLSRYYQALVFSCMPSQCLQHVLLASFI